MFTPLKLSGTGLHSGLQTNITISPEAKGKGRYFVRVDLPITPLFQRRSHLWLQLCYRQN